MQIRNSFHLRHYKIRESALDKIVSVSECWSWSRTVGNLLRNILKLQPRQYSGHRQYRQQTVQYRQQTVQTTGCPGPGFPFLLAGHWCINVRWLGRGSVGGDLGGAPELTSDH